MTHLAKQSKPIGATIFGSSRGFWVTNKQLKKDNPGNIQPLHTNSAMTGEYLQIGDLPNNIANPAILTRKNKTHCS